MTSVIIEMLGYMFLFCFILIVIWSQVPVLVCFVKYLADKKNKNTSAEKFKEYYEDQEYFVHKVKIIIIVSAVVIYGLYAIEKNSRKQAEEAYEKAYTDGYEEGHRAGFGEGYEEGFESGYSTSQEDDEPTLEEWLEMK